MPNRKRMPDTRDSITQKLQIRHAGNEWQSEWQAERMRDKLQRIQTLITQTGSDATLIKISNIINEPDKMPSIHQHTTIYIQTGLYPDTGQPGEIFLKTSKMGSLASGLLDSLSMSISVALQAGVPLKWFIDKMKNLQFEPSGPTNIPEIRRATSIVDALARWLELKFPTSP
jgi:hypothetical protein